MAYLDPVQGARREGTVGNTLTADLAAESVTNAKLAAPKIGYIQETILKSAFTDGGGASGTKVMTSQIPAGAIVFCAPKVTVNVAFNGDTSAVITIGDGSDADRYHTGTPSVFTAAATGIEMGIPSGSKYHAAAQNVTITVTSASDFTNVAAGGSITVTIYYLQTA